MSQFGHCCAEYLCIPWYNSDSLSRSSSVLSRSFQVFSVSHLYEREHPLLGECYNHSGPLVNQIPPVAAAINKFTHTSTYDSEDTEKLPTQVLESQEATIMAKSLTSPVALPAVSVTSVILLTQVVAVHKVLNTIELLKTILLHLPTKNLLFSQLVSTKFRDAVRPSLQLQRAYSLLQDLQQRTTVVQFVIIFSKAEAWNGKYLK